MSRRYFLTSKFDNFSFMFRFQGKKKNDFDSMFLIALAYIAY